MDKNLYALGEAVEAASPVDSVDRLRHHLAMTNRHLANINRNLAALVSVAVATAETHGVPVPLAPFPEATDNNGEA
jgi:hypothetical protein